MAKRKILYVIIPMAFLLAFYIGLKSFANKKAESFLEEAFQKSASYAEISCQDVSVDLFGLNTHLKGISIVPVGSEKRTVIDHIVVYNMDRKNDFPRNLKIAVHGIHLDPASSISDYFQDLEFDSKKIKIDFDLEYIYKTNEKSFYIHRLTYGSPEIGKFSLNLHISNIDLDSDNLFLTSSSFLDLFIHKAELRYNDNSFVDKFLKMKAKDEGKEKDQYVHEILGEIDKTFEASKDSFFKSFLSAVKRFVRNPDVIFIRIKPDEPITLERLLDIQTMEEAVILLNISVGT